jgi:hypothetical protein
LKGNPLVEDYPISNLHRLQSNRYLITFKDADHCGRYLKC